MCIQKFKEAKNSFQIQTYLIVLPFALLRLKNVAFFFNINRRFVAILCQATLISTFFSNIICSPLTIFQTLFHYYYICNGDL